MGALKYFRNVGLKYPRPLENSYLERSWHEFRVGWEYTPPHPQKFRFGQILALWVWVGLNYPPPTPKIKIWTDLGTLSLSWCGVSPLPNPKIQIWTDLGTLSLSWSEVPPPRKLRFGQILALWVWVGVEYPPSPIRKFRFGQILALWVWVGLESPTPRPPPRVSRSSYVETNFCILRGYYLVISCNTRLHSSRMCTARLLPVSLSMHCAWGGGVCSGGCLPLVQGGLLGGGACLWSLGCLVRGVPASGPGGVPASGPGGVSQHAMGQTSPLWTEWLTDRCKNITFANFVCGR